SRMLFFKICSPNKATSRCLVLSYDILCKWHVNRPTLFMTTPSKILILRQILSYLLDRFNAYAISFGIKTPNRSHLQNRRILIPEKMYKLFTNSFIILIVGEKTKISTGEDCKMKKIIVIGSGILGATTAYKLAKSGAQVTVIDRNEYGQATGSAAGIICPWLTQRRNQAWYWLAKEGARLYPILINELKEDGETKTGYAQTGAIHMHRDEQKLFATEQRALKRLSTAPEMGTITRLD